MTKHSPSGGPREPPGEGRRSSSGRAVGARRRTVAAFLLAASVAVPVVGTVSAMNGWYWGLGERYWVPLWSVLQVCATPIGNVLSLLLGDRRRPWVKLNYLIIALWLIIGAAMWAFSRFVVITK